MYDFGKIKHNVFEIVSQGIAENDIQKKNLLKKYIKLVKESKILKQQSSIYYNLESRCDEDAYSALDYIKENISLLRKYGISDIVKENKRVSFILEGYDLVDDYEHKELHENIHKLIHTKKNSKTINDISESLKFIKEHINNNKLVIKESKDYLIPNSMMKKVLLKKYCERFSSLSENEVKIVESVLKKNYELQNETFDTYKKETLNTINENLKTDDLELKSKLLDVKEKLLESKYNKETFVTDITKIIKLHSNFNA